MSSTPWLFADESSQARRAANDLIKTHSERLAVEQLEREEHRQQRLAEQRSTLNSPEVRIRTWEKLHGLRLPSDPNHMVLSLVARSTGLTLSEVRDEQRARSAQAPAQSAAPKLRAEDG